MREQERTEGELEGGYAAAYDRIMDTVRQLRAKEGPVYERWKAGMRRFLESLEEEGD